MNVVLWVLQVLLALHTAIGAVWKFSNPEQPVPSLKAIPRGAWLGLGVVELLIAVGLVVPALDSDLGILAPIAAILVAAEMLLFTALHVVSDESDHGPVIYWLVVAAVCAFIAYGRLVLQPF